MAKSTKDMIDDIMIAVKAGALSAGNYYLPTDEILLALCFKDDSELREICRELYIGVN